MALMVLALAPVGQLAKLRVEARQRVWPVIYTLTPLPAFVARVYLPSVFIYALEELKAPVVVSPSDKVAGVPHEVLKTQKVSVSKTLAVMLMLSSTLNAMPP